MNDNIKDTKEKNDDITQIKKEDAVPSKDETVPKKDETVPKVIESTYTIAIIAFTISLVYTIYYIFSYDTDRSINDSLAFSRMIDMITLCVVFVLSILMYYLTNKEKKYQILEKSIDNTERFVNGGNAALISVSILVLYVIIFISGVPMTGETKSITITIFESLLWILLLFILFTELVKIVFDTNLNPIIFKYLRSILTNYKNDFNDIEVDDKITDNRVIDKEDNGPEVFHVSNNLYDYEEAQSICRSFDSRLATYDEIEKSYNNGGEFCGYGWSDGQMILFPTQKETYDKLQLVPGHGNDCGRTGVNGGYMSNPTLQFGVNCYGKKPKGIDPTPKNNQDIVTQKTATDIVTDAKVKYLQENKDELLVLDPFNKNKWSEY